MMQCCVCQTNCDTTKTPIYCSEKCSLVAGAVIDLGKEIAYYTHTQDTRIFFYDTPFGDLCDKYTIMLLRRVHVKTLAEQQESDFHLTRMYTGMLSKVNRLVYAADTKQKIGNIIYELLLVNAKLWRWRDTAHDTRMPNATRLEASMDYLNATDERDILRRELDSLVEGKEKLVRVFPK